MGVAASAKTGDRAKALRSLRDLLAAAVDTADERYVAALAKQLRETLAELDSLPVGEGRSASDDLAAKRRARLSTTAGAAGPGRGGVDVGQGGG